MVFYSRFYPGFQTTKIYTCHGMFPDYSENSWIINTWKFILVVTVKSELLSTKYFNEPSAALNGNEEKCEELNVISIELIIEVICV